MEDQKIIDLYTNREERAIHETDKKYGRLCTSISMGILNDIRDSEECVSDTWLTLWNQIPPKKPNPFKAYICRIIKNLSLKRYEYHHAKKRNSQYDLSLEELRVHQQRTKCRKSDRITRIKMDRLQSSSPGGEPLTL